MAKRISQLTALTSASLDTTLLGIDRGVSYKVELDVLADAVKDRINTLDDIRLDSLENFTASFTVSVTSGTISGSSQLTSSFDTRYTLSGSVVNVNTASLVNRLNVIESVTSSYETNGRGIISSSVNLVTTSSFNSYTASQSTSSLVDRLNTIESVSGSWITESETGSFLTSLSGAISSSSQISDLGFVTGSYTTINSFNSLTQSFNSISQSFNVISGSVGTIDFSTLATTGSNIFTGGQTISGSLLINSKDVVFTNRLYVTASSSIGIPASNDALISVGGTQGDIQLWPAFFSINYRTGLNNEAKSGFSYERLYFSSSYGQHKLEHIDGNFDIDTNIIISGSLNVSGSITGSTNFNTIVNKPTLISGSSQLTSSYDTRYTLSGSVQPLPSNLLSSSAQITAFGFISSSTTIPTGTISGSSQLTSSYDTRYTLSGSVVSGTTPAGTISGSSQLTSSFDSRYVLETETGSLQTSITSLNSFSASENTKSNTLATYTSSLNIWTSSVATTGSNSFNGSQTITGSLIVSAVAVVNGGITVPTGSVITLTTGSSISVDSSGAITGSLTGSVFGIGDVVAFSSSVNSRIISGSVVAGTISSSAQLTTAFPSKTTGAWSVPAGASTQSLSLDANSSYTMWVNGNVPNGIITWNATATISNTNVPVLGAQYGWYYAVGNALVLTAMPDQFTGTNGSILTTPGSYAPNTSNVFKFGITNNSGTTQTINYGYIKLS
jgi:hypothetical protein